MSAGSWTWLDDERGNLTQLEVRLAQLAQMVENVVSAEHLEMPYRPLSTVLASALASGLEPQLTYGADGLTQQVVGLPAAERAREVDSLLSELLSPLEDFDGHNPSDLNSLIVALAASEAGTLIASWFDPACGSGGIASALMTAGMTAASFAGQELNGLTAEVARARGVLAGNLREIREGNALTSDRFLGETFDAAVCVPPFGRFSISGGAAADAAWNRPNLQTPELAVAFIQVCVSKLQPPSAGGGVACVVLPSGALRSAKPTRATRQWLAESGHLQALVQLPHGILNSSSMAPQVAVLSTRPDRRRPDSIRFVDASAQFGEKTNSDEPRSRAIAPSRIAQIVELVASDGNSSVSVSLPAGELKRKLVSFNWQPGLSEASQGLDVRLELAADASVDTSIWTILPPDSARLEAVEFLMEFEVLLGSQVSARERLEKRHAGSLIRLAELAAMADRAGTMDNSVFVNRMRPTAAFTVRPDDFDRQKVIEVPLPDDVVLAEYIALVLSSDFGSNMLRRSGVMVPRLTIDSLLGTRVPIPPIERQREVVEMASRLAILSSEADSLRQTLAADHNALGDVIESIEDLNAESDLSNWLNQVPYPLSSAIWAHRSMEGPHAKEKQLFRAFEASSEFVALVLLSAALSDEEFGREQLGPIVGQLASHQMGFERSTWGTWTTVITSLAKRFRTMLNGGPDDRARCLRMFGTSDERLVTSLTAKPLGTLLVEVQSLRNRWDGHPGIRSGAEAEEHVLALQGMVTQLHESMQRTWRRTKLVMPGRSEFAGGKYHYSAKNLTGLRVPFENVDVVLGSPMEAGRLHLVFPEDESSLELLPIVQLGPAPADANEAIYFFNRLESNGLVRLVSYHHQDAPDIEIDSPALSSVIARLGEMGQATGL